MPGDSSLRAGSWHFLSLMTSRDKGVHISGTEWLRLANIQDPVAPFSLLSPPFLTGGLLRSTI
jgi:hypothetical protein